MTMLVVGVEGEEPVDRGVGLAPQTVLDPLAHHRALFARDGEHVRLDVRRDLLAEVEVDRLPRPLRLPCGTVSQLEMRDTQPAGDLARGGVQDRHRRGIGHRNTSVRAERERDEPVPEEEALHFRER